MAVSELTMLVIISTKREREAPLSWSTPPACFSCRYTNNFQFQALEHLGPKYERLICRTLPVKIGAKGKAMFPDRLSRKPVSVESDRI